MNINYVRVPRDWENMNSFQLMSCPRFIVFEMYTYQLVGFLSFGAFRRVSGEADGKAIKRW
jgi:hypothetical protein